MVKWERQAYYLTSCISSQTVINVVAGKGTKACRNIDEAVINSVGKNQRKFLAPLGALDQRHPIELSAVMEMVSICAVRYESHMWLLST